MLEDKWHITLLNGLALRQGEQTIQRFRTQKTGEMLAFLALNLDRSLTREELADKIWSENELGAARASVRTALASLRHQLEPPGVAANSVLQTDRVSIRLRSSAVTTDVARFRAACQREAEAAPEEQLAAGLEAARLYTGDLLPGCYGDWVFEEREGLAQQNMRILRVVATGLWKQGDQARSLEYARRLISADPLREEACVLAMRLYAASGRSPDALRCFENFRQILHAEVGETPSSAASMLAQQIADACGRTITPGATRRPQAVTAPNRAPKALLEHDLPAPKAADDQVRKSVRLPLTLTPFFGRETEILDVLRVFRPEAGRFASANPPTAARLVTLSGPGGAGKTRLAIEAARRMADQWPLSVTFVPLADIEDAARIPGAIAASLALDAALPENVLDGIVGRLADEPHLLVLDNFEQLLPPYGSAQTSGPDDAAPSLIYELLSRCPGLCCLVTSRQCLDIDGEREYPLGPLPTPEYAGTPERLLDFASVQLFVNRAQAARPDFQLTPHNSEVVRTLCSRLDGLPLALELAAAWSSVLTPAQIHQRLAHRFELLVSRRKGRLSRHQTLRAAIEWSYRLLDPEMRTFFARLSVFRGGWLTAAAEQICEEPRALEFLRALRDRSLVTLEERSVGDSEEMRFRLLESLREFAAEQMSDAERADLRLRHLRWHADWSDAINPQLMRSEQSIWLHRVEEETENLKAAVQTSQEHPAYAKWGLKLIGNLQQFWSIRGNDGELRTVLDRLLADAGPDADVDSRLRAMMLAGSLALFREDWDGAHGYYDACLQFALHHGKPGFAGAALMSLGSVATHQGDLEGARSFYEESLPTYEAFGSALGVASAWGGLGSLALMNRDFETARDCLIRCIAVQRQEKNLSGVTHNIRQLGLAYAGLGDSGQASACLSESVAGYWELRDTRGLAMLLADLVEILPPSVTTVRLMAVARALAATAGAAALDTSELEMRCRSVLGDEAFDAARAEGAALATLHAVEEARTLLAGSHHLLKPALTHN